MRKTIRERTPGFSGETVEGLKLLHSAKAAHRSELAFVVLCHPINRHNFKRIDSIVDLAIANRLRCNLFLSLQSPAGQVGFVFTLVRRGDILVPALGANAKTTPDSPVAAQRRRDAAPL